MKNIQLTVLALIALTLSLPASAQRKKSNSTINNKAVNLKSTSLPTTNTRETLIYSRATGVGNEYLIAAPSLPIASGAALSSFRLWYNNGDHKIRTIGVLHEQGTMNAKFSDQNGDDPFRAEANWISVKGATGGTVIAAGSGTFNIQLPIKPANTTLVLSGFSFERASGTDSNLRTMSVRMDQENSLVQVSFLDDQREDYRSVDSNLLVSGALLVVPFGTIISTGMSLESLLNGAKNDSKNTARPYAATIQYAYIPNSQITSNGSVSGSDPNRIHMTGQIPRKGPMAYRGFVLRFNNSDHHLLGMGIHINGLKSFPGQRGGDEDAVTWRDNNADDPMQYIIEYSVLK